MDVGTEPDDLAKAQFLEERNELAVAEAAIRQDVPRLSEIGS